MTIRKGVRQNPDGTVRHGKPPLLTPELTAEIVTLVEAGNYPSVAAAYHGVRPSTYSEWMARGERPDHPRNLGSDDDITIYATFAEAIRAAEAKGEVRVVIGLIRSAQLDGATAIRFLERRYGARWRQQDVLSLSGPDGGPVLVETIGAVLEDHEKQVLRDIIVGELARREALARAVEE